MKYKLHISFSVSTEPNYGGSSAIPEPISVTFSTWNRLAWFIGALVELTEDAKQHE